MSPLSAPTMSDSRSGRRPSAQGSPPSLPGGRPSRVVAALLVASLSGCASLQPPPLPEDKILRAYEVINRTVTGVRAAVFTFKLAEGAHVVDAGQSALARTAYVAWQGAALAAVEIAGKTPENAIPAILLAGRELLDRLAGPNVGALGATDPVPDPLPAEREAAKSALIARIKAPF